MTDRPHYYLEPGELVRLRPGVKHPPLPKQQHTLRDRVDNPTAILHSKLGKGKNEGWCFEADLRGRNFWLTSQLEVIE